MVKPFFETLGSMSRVCLYLYSPSVSMYTVSDAVIDPLLISTGQCSLDLIMGRGKFREITHHGVTM